MSGQRVGVLEREVKKMGGHPAVSLERSAGPLKRDERAVLSRMRDPNSWVSDRLIDWAADAAKAYWEGGKNPWEIQRLASRLVPIFERWLRDHIAVCKDMAETARKEGHLAEAERCEREAEVARTLLEQRPPNSSWSDEMECLVLAPSIRIVVHELVHILKVTGTKNPNHPEVEAFVRSEVPQRMGWLGQIRPAVVEAVLARVRAQMRAAQRRRRSLRKGA